MRFAVGLYPAAWRARYGQEFEALLEDIGPCRRDVWNVVKGALKMQMLTWSSWKLVPALGVAGALIAGVAAFTMHTEYESTCVIGVRQVPEAPGEGPRVAIAQRTADLFTKALSRESLAKIVADERLYPREAEKGTLEDAVARMQRDVRLAAFPPTGGPTAAIMLSFRYPDARTAQHVTGMLMRHAIVENSRWDQASQTPSQVEILDAASMPAEPIFPNRPFMILVGLTAGLLLALAIAGARQLRRGHA
jgi:LPS O-antigen subunit length determinant protein (WzzB/FepE family)